MSMTMPPSAPIHKAAVLARIRDTVERGRRFLVTSHVRPDGDSIGSQLALAAALRSLGKQARVVNADEPPDPYRGFPGVDQIEVARAVDGEFDAVWVIECSDLDRTGLTGLEGASLVNIDHHPGNTAFGAINWLDETAAACGELIYELLAALDVPLTREIATHLYLAILTDTGSFHHSHVTARTFDICRRLVEAGVDPTAVAQQAFNSSSVDKLKLMGTVLSAMQVEAGGRLAVLQLDETALLASGARPGDTEGLANVPLTAREIEAVALFKLRDGEIRVSLRSKGAIDVREVALAYGGGGHKNASGFTVQGRLDEVRGPILARVAEAIERARRP
jgi:phosphoesterase RecJ-like protein